MITKIIIYPYAQQFIFIVTKTLAEETHKQINDCYIIINKYYLFDCIFDSHCGSIS